MDQDEIQNILNRYNVPYDTWGTGKAKSFADLEREIAEGECELVEENNELFRRVYGVEVSVY